MTDSVGQYLNEIGLVPLLTAMEERELSQAVEAGVKARAAIEAGEDTPENRRLARKGAEAKDRFIRANLRLVVSVARRYPLPPAMELLDLIQEGNLGPRARRRQVRLAQGVQVLHLRHVLDPPGHRPGARPEGLARAPARRPLGQPRAALRQVSGDGDELDEENARLYRLTTPTSLDRTVGDDDGSELIDLIADDKPGPADMLVHNEEQALVGDLLGVLDDRARSAVEQRFGLTDGRKRSYREVGETLGVTAEAARRLVKRAVTAVREEALARSDAA